MTSFNKNVFIIKKYPVEDSTYNGSLQLFHNFELIYTGLYINQKVQLSDMASNLSSNCLLMVLFMQESVALFQNVLVTA